MKCYHFFETSDGDVRYFPEYRGNAARISYFINYKFKIINSLVSLLFLYTCPPSRFLP